MEVGRGKLLKLQEKRRDLLNISVGGKCLKPYSLQRMSFEQQVSNSKSRALYN